MVKTETHFSSGNEEQMRNEKNKWKTEKTNKFFQQWKLLPLDTNKLNPLFKIKHLITF